MNKYYTLTCIILPITLIAACSASGTKKSNVEKRPQTISTQEVEITKEKHSPIVNKEQMLTDKVIPENEKFPLIQTADTNKAIQPIKRMYQFGFNQQELDNSDKQSLLLHANYLRNHSDTTLQLIGHSDTQGNKHYNVFLSKERAKKIANYLVSQGVSNDQLIIKGLGDSQPLNDVDNFRENRRVELQYLDSRIASKK